MEYRVISYNSLIKKITKKDTLFNGNYCIDTYQNCEFGCKYCDSSIENTIYIKLDVDETLNKELKNLKKGVIIVGSVNDPYQKAEEKYKTTRRILEVIKNNNFPCHILTKSDLILRDIDLLTEMDCTVTISIMSLKETITKIFENNVPPPLQRLKTLESIAEKGITAGVALIPIMPHLIDAELDEIVRKSKEFKAQYFLHKFLDLKGEQKEIFMNIISSNFPHILSKFRNLYKDNYQIDEILEEKYNQKIYTLCKKFNLPEKINSKIHPNYTKISTKFIN